MLARTARSFYKGHMTASAQELTSGLDHHKAGRLKEAAEVYNRVLATEPANAEALHLSGVMAFQENRFVDAVGWFQRAVASAPTVAKYLGNLGAALTAAGRDADALPHLEAAIALDASCADVLNSYGAALRDLGRGDAAADAYRRAIVASPTFALAHNNLIALLLQQGKADEAAQAADRAIAAVPDSPDLHNIRAITLRERGAVKEARAALEKALALAPDHADALRNFGMFEEEQGDLAGAKRQYRRAIESAPRVAAAYANLAGVLLRQGRVIEAIPLYRQAADLGPETPSYRSAIIGALGDNPHIAPAEIAEECRRFDAEFAFAFKFTTPVHGNDRTPDRRLRVGYVAPQFGRHAAPARLLTLLAGHDRAAFDAVVYTNRRGSEDGARRIESLGFRVRDIAASTDDAVAEMVRADEIDVLIDLAGHTPGNRLLVFARKPAPVAVSWPPEPQTSGLDGIGHVIADPITVPESDASLFTESVLRLPAARHCFAEPLPAAPARDVTGPVTLWSCARPPAVAERVVEFWAEVLREIPGVSLVLANGGFAESETASDVRQRFTRRDVAADRIVLRPGASWEDAVAANALVLDGSPRSDEAATVAALSFGLPVIALVGDRPLARQGAAVLIASGLAELVAATPGDYVRIARGLATDASRRSALATTLPAKFAASPVCDTAGFARQFEALLRKAWRDWCLGPA